MKTERKINEEAEVVFYNYDLKTKELSYLKNKAGEKAREVVIPLKDMHLKIQAGNIKIGSEWVLNTVPGDHPIIAKGREITNVRGSCQGCCDGCENFCYAINGCRQHHNSVMPSVLKNLILYREDRERFLTELRVELNKIIEMKKYKDGETPIIFRWHASGEIENYQYLEDMMEIALEYSSINFYSYTKRFGYIKRYLDEHGAFPANFVWNLSQWKDNIEKAGFPEEYKKEVQIFAWDDGDDPAMEKMIHCPSVLKTKGQKKGHLSHEMTCAKCGMCWKGRLKGKTIAVYNH